MSETIKPGAEYSGDELHDDEIDTSDEMRQHLAKELGLPDDATWDDVVDAQDENERVSSARVLGLSDDAAWSDIASAEDGEGNRISQALLLGLDSNAGWREIVAEQQRRRKELHEKIAKEMTEGK